MRRKSRLRLRVLTGTVSLLWLAAADAGAQGELTADAAARLVAERFGVEVLRVTEGEEDARPVYVVTVMNPGGDYDGAFQVTRLMVDRTTGELVSQFRHQAAGYELPGGAGADTGESADGRAIRRLSNQDRTPPAGQ